MIAKIKLTVALVLLVISGTYGWLFSSKPDEEKPEWDKMSVTFLKFNGMPTTVNEAESQGWTKIDSCQDDAYFRGNRYILKGDTSVMLLFDSNGKISGTQCGVPKSQATQKFFKQDAWVEDGDMVVVTAYFVDPNVICNGKRPESGYIGDSLSIQTGPTPSSLLKIPLTENELTNTKWVEGKCVWGMGKHYWYDISTNMNCDNYFPAFLLYNKGKLNAFGWVAMGNFASKRYEHPPTSVLDYFYQPETQPICVKQLAALSTMHIYLDRRPYFNFC